VDFQQQHEAQQPLRRSKGLSFAHHHRLFVCSPGGVWQQPVNVSVVCQALDAQHSIGQVLQPRLEGLTEQLCSTAIASSVALLMVVNEVEQEASHTEALEEEMTVPDVVGNWRCCWHR
jgi:hypothetical protein